jgi:hypothetical protein
MSLFDAPVEIPEHRVVALAHVLAGFAHPDRGSFEKLTGKQRSACLNAARACLERLATEPDE